MRYEFPSQTDLGLCLADAFHHLVTIFLFTLLAFYGVLCVGKFCCVVNARDN